MGKWPWIALAAWGILPAALVAQELVPFSDAVFQDQALHLARAALVSWTEGRPPVLPSALHPALLCQAGVFVSLETRQHVVRGCRGTLTPATGRLADEILANVRQACALDPLHARLRPQELGQVRIVLCIPGRTRTVWPGQTWDAHTCGVLVEAGPRAAVMLPYEAPDSEHQVMWGRKRARIAPGEACHMVCFDGVRFAEPFAPVASKPAATPTLPYW